MLPSQIPVEAAVMWQESPVQFERRRVRRNQPSEVTPQHATGKSVGNTQSTHATTACYGTSRFKRARLKLEQERELERETSGYFETPDTQTTCSTGLPFDEAEAEWNVTAYSASDNETLTPSISLDKVAENVLARLGASDSETSFSNSPLVTFPTGKDKVDARKSGLPSSTPVRVSAARVRSDSRYALVGGTPRSLRNRDKQQLQPMKMEADLSITEEQMRELLEPDDELLQQALSSQRIDISEETARTAPVTRAAAAASRANDHRVLPANRSNAEPKEAAVAVSRSSSTVTTTTAMVTRARVNQVQLQTAANVRLPAPQTVSNARNVVQVASTSTREFNVALNNDQCNKQRPITPRLATVTAPVQQIQATIRSYDANCAMQSRANLPTTRSTVGSSAINKPMRPNSTPSVLPVAKSNNAFGVDFPDDDASFSQLCDVLNLLESQHGVQRLTK